MPDNISRRTFLKAGIASACTLAIPSVAQAQAHPQLATLLDIRKCVGCEACVEACREANAVKFPKPRKPFPKMYPSRVKPEDWSDKKEVRDRLTPYNWLFIQHAVIEADGKKPALNIPRRCMHCVNPPCVKLCPWGAAEQFENGISRINTDLCLGGAKCRDVCPWQIPQRQTGAGLYLELLPSLAGNGIMNKCDRCYQRVAKGEVPACIEACPENVQTMGPRDEIIRKARELAAEIRGYVYGENENGGTNTIYVSPVPFEQINKVIGKGKGKPHLEPAENRMEKAEYLAAAMVIAPLAGAAAAIGKFLGNAKSARNKETT